MSTAEILAELPRLSARERAEILERLWTLKEQAGPTEREKSLLDEAQARYDANPSEGTPWREVEAPARPLMRCIVFVRPKAEQDLSEAWDWYERRSPGLGGEFLEEFASAMRTLEQSPERERL